jgi:glycosyltransferase involved in cell wall biosynthesis
MNDKNKSTALNCGLSIILPALNEEDNLKPFVEEIVDYFDGVCDKYEVIVVNDGSTDSTGELARTLSIMYKNIRVIHHSERQGYGNSLKDGFHASKYDRIFFTDADRQFKIKSFDAFLPILKAEDVDMVIGYRIGRQDTILRKFCAWFFNLLMRSLFSLSYKDINCAFKIFKKEAFECLDIKTVDSLFNVELLVKATLKRLRIVQVGVNHYPRLQGKSSVAYRSIPLIIKQFFSLYREIKTFSKKHTSQAVRIHNYS